MKGDMPLMMYAIFTIVGTIWVFIVVFTMDRIGRRTLFLIAFPTLAACLFAEGLLQVFYLGTTNKAGNAACVFFLFLYIICYQAVDAPSFVWSAEIFPTTIRAKGLGLTLFAYFVGAITYTTPSALAFKNIKWGMYFLYCGLCLISEVIVYFFIPETKCMPLEELGALFGDDVVVHLAADGRGIVEDVGRLPGEKEINCHEQHKVDGEKGLVTHEEKVGV
jgi:MFS family permease